MRPDSKPQALRRLVEQLRLRKNAAADSHHRVGGQDKGAAQFIVELHIFQRRRGLGVRQPRCVGARNLAAPRRFIEVRRLERIGLDAGLIDQGKPARRTGSEHEFGTADHHVRVMAMI